MYDLNRNVFHCKPCSISNMLAANISVWMLTGDKIRQSHWVTVVQYNFLLLKKSHWGKPWLLNFDVVRIQSVLLSATLGGRQPSTSRWPATCSSRIWNGKISTDSALRARFCRMVPGSAGCLKWDSLPQIWETTRVYFLKYSDSSKKEKTNVFNLFVSVFPSTTLKSPEPQLHLWACGSDREWRCYTMTLSHTDAALVQDSSTRLVSRHFFAPHTWKVCVSESNKCFTNVLWDTFTKLKRLAQLTLSTTTGLKRRVKHWKQIGYPTFKSAFH